MIWKIRRFTCKLRPGMIHYVLSELVYLFGDISETVPVGAGAVFAIAKEKERYQSPENALS